MPHTPFEYPQKEHQRRHTPRQYAAYPEYKDFLRDEFLFRCVYCLVRETWQGSGRFFSVEHFAPKSKHSELTCEYGNLLYACMDCNCAKGGHELPAYLQPECSPFGLHL